MKYLVIPMITNHITTIPSELNRMQMPDQSSLKLDFQVKIASNCLWTLALAKHGSTDPYPFLMVPPQKKNPGYMYPTEEAPNEVINIPHLMLEITTDNQQGGIVDGYVS